jgi:site-specific DNA-methyltransferase (adenine-specific)
MTEIRIDLRNGNNRFILPTIPSNSIDSLVTDPPAGIAFMGREWDEDKGCRNDWIKWMQVIAKECYRILKPGAYGLVWALPRTSHWTATAFENGGFNIRDVVVHLFGSGFPKSLDISKAIDKEVGVDREKVRVYGKEYRNPKSIKGGHGVAGGDRPIMQRTREQGYYDIDGNTPVTWEAKRWQGFGTSLKPSNERWVLVQKPFSEDVILIQKPIDKATIATNIVMHGVGALNIEDSKIAPKSEKDLKEIQSERDTPAGGFAGYADKEKITFAVNNVDRTDRSYITGRFPSNTVFTHHAECRSIINEDQFEVWECHEDCPLKIMDAQSADVSRFFYCAKASKSDKGGDMNIHPTVKSSQLMEYLIRLITPPGGVVLDPFMGSGSTGVSAVRNGYGFVGIEKQLEYFAVAEKRVNAERKGV